MLAVAEPTSMTLLPLAVSLDRAPMLRLKECDAAAPGFQPLCG